jgi:ribosomal RNA-processing protein 12
VVPQLCLELLLTIALRNRDRIEVLWPLVHKMLAAIMAPDAARSANPLVLNPVPCQCVSWRPAMPAVCQSVARNPKPVGRVQDEEAIERNKRKRSDGYNSDDSDFDDLRAKVADASAAMKNVRFAASAAGTGAERSVKSMGVRSAASGRSGKSDRSGRSERDAKKGPTITGDRYKAKHKGKPGGGDAKGNSKHEPFAYWPLDKRLTNRRPDKQAAAKSGLASIVQGAKAGALKGAKAKRQKLAR